MRMYAHHSEPYVTAFQVRPEGNRPFKGRSQAFGSKQAARLSSHLHPRWRAPCVLKIDTSSIPFLSLRGISNVSPVTHRCQRNQGGELLEIPTTPPLCWAGSAAPGHEFGGADGYMVDYARGAGVAEEEHLGSWSFPAELPQRWGGLVQAAGAAQPGSHGESKRGSSPPLHPTLQQTACPCALSTGVTPTRSVVWLLFLRTDPWSNFFCRSRRPLLLSAAGWCALVSVSLQRQLGHCIDQSIDLSKKEANIRKCV